MKVLVAIDGSPCSDAAIAEVCRRPWPANTEVHVITVDPPIDPSFVRGASPTVFDEIVKQQRADAEKLLRSAAATLTEKLPGVHVTAALLEGWPKDAIVTEAERFGADLVVVGSHGYGPIRRFFLGSVSLFVVHHAPCSVLIVRQPPEIAVAGTATPTY